MISDKYFKEYARLVITVGIVGGIIAGLLMNISPIIGFIIYIIISLYLLYELFMSVETMIYEILNES